MRVRLCSVDPLPALKVWHYLDVGSPLQKTVADLKTEICESILLNATKNIITNKQLSIFLEDFELLDDTAVNILNDNDLLVLKYRGSQLAGMKRKRDHDSILDQLRGTSKALMMKGRAATTTSSSSSSSSASSSSSSSDSSSGQSSSSDTDTTSTDGNSSSSSSTPFRATSSSSLVPSQTTSKSLASSAAGTLKNRNTSSPTVPNHLQTVFSVPPGEGKPATHRRNARRRKRRLVEKDQRLQLSNGADEAEIRPPSTVSGLSELASSMARIAQNTNKRRGYKQNFQGILLTAPQDGVNGSFLTAYPSKPTKRLRPIPPSERTGLPQNIIITSVDVEAGDSEDVPPRRLKESDRLDPSTPGQPVTLPSAPNPEIDWDAYEKQWETSLEIDPTTPLDIGTILLWKDLALDPIKFTPELLLHAAEIISIAEDGQLTLQMIFKTYDEEDISGADSTTHFLKERSDLSGYRVHSKTTGS